MLKEILKHTLFKNNLQPLHLVFNLDKTDNDRLTEENINLLASDFESLIYLDIKGNDVFNNPKLMHLVNAFAMRKGFVCLSIYTSSVKAELLTQTVEAILKLKGEFTLKIIFSMDNVAQKLDLLPGKEGEFAALSANIADLAAIKKTNARLKIETVTVISKNNITELIDIMTYVKDKIKDIDFHNLSFMQNSFDKDKTDSAIPHVNSLEARKTLILRTWKHYLQKKKTGMFMKKLTMGFLSLFIDKALLIIKDKKMIINCSAGVVYAMVNSSGDVFFCSFANPVANLASYNFSFSRLWYSSEAINRRKSKQCACYDESIIRDSLLFNKKFYFEIFKRKGMWTEI